MTQRGFRLTHDALDEEVETSDHPTFSEAVDAAERWFREGYENNPTLPATGVEIEEDVTRLRDDLCAGREFYCSRFYERASIEPLTTRDEFVDGYMERSGIPAEDRTEDGFRVGALLSQAMPCRCGEEGCEGWEMVTGRLNTAYNDTFSRRNDGSGYPAIIERRD